MAHTDYVESLMTHKGLSKSASILARQINKDKELLGIQAIAVSGTSGLVIGGLLSYKTKLPLIIVRKIGDNSHSIYDVEFDNYNNEISTGYCIVDDLIATGNTVYRIVEKLKHEFPDSVSLKKIYLYWDETHCEADTIKKYPAFAIYQYSKNRKEI